LFIKGYQKAVQEWKKILAKHANSKILLEYTKKTINFIQRYNEGTKIP
jgi:hypothetical protein